MLFLGGRGDAKENSDVASIRKRSQKGQKESQRKPLTETQVKNLAQLAGYGLQLSAEPEPTVGSSTLTNTQTNALLPGNTMQSTPDDQPNAEKGSSICSTNANPSHPNGLEFIMQNPNTLFGTQPDAAMGSFNNPVGYLPHSSPPIPDTGNLATNTSEVLRGAHKALFPTSESDSPACAQCAEKDAEIELLQHALASKDSAAGTYRLIIIIFYVSLSSCPFSADPTAVPVPQFGGGIVW